MSFSIHHRNGDQGREISINFYFFLFDGFPNLPLSQSIVDLMESQKVEKDEENVVTVEITGEMTRLEIMNLVLEKTERKTTVKDDQTPKSKLCNIL